MDTVGILSYKGCHVDVISWLGFLNTDWIVTVKRLVGWDSSKMSVSCNCNFSEISDVMLVVVLKICLNYLVVKWLDKIRFVVVQIVFH